MRITVSGIMLLVSLLSISMHVVLVKAEPSFIDIRIVNLTASPTTVCVGETVNVTVTYERMWIDVWPEAWPGIGFYCDGALINYLFMIIMGSGYDIRTLTFDWDTSNVEPASYMITAIVYGDDDPIGNTFMFGPIQVLPYLTPPNITILSPQNTTYTTDHVPLAFTVDEPTSWIGYSLDDQVNVTIGGNITLTGLSDGTHTITVYADDTAGNMGSSDTVYFTIALPYGSIRNLDTNLTYLTIQSAINAPETLNGHTIFVETGIYYEHVVANKSLSLIGENRYNTIIDGNGTGNVIEVTASNCKITGFNIQNSGSLKCGIYVVQWNTGNNISYNILTNNYWGIWLYRSCDNTVSGNNVSSNDYIGIWVDSSGNNTVSGNNVSSNNYVGIRLDYSSSNNSMVSGNIVSNNDYGIFLASSANNNTICGNNVANNNYGIYLSGTSNNMFFHNNFVGNTQQVVSYDPSLWDNGCEGNYWSNYNGTDINDDGIGDTELPCENVDNYPLMNPYWLPGDVNHDLKIDIYDVVRITGVYGSEQGDPNWNCHSDIAEPYGIINIYDVVTCTKDYRKEYTP